jgi:hypothetical protein
MMMIMILMNVSAGGSPLCNKNLVLLYSCSGGIFPEELKSTPVEIAFKYAVYAVNRERKLLGNNTTLVYRTLYYKNNDIFQAAKIGKPASIIGIPQYWEILCLCANYSHYCIIALPEQ